MAFVQVRNVVFGRTQANATGSTGVGYTLYDQTGSIVEPRTTSGVFQLISGSANYSAPVSFPDGFRGSLLWDTGTAFPTVCYTTEQFNMEENSQYTEMTFDKLCSITGSIDIMIDQVQKLSDIECGRWLIENNQMKFYKPDNVTLVAVFDLFDCDGVPTEDAVFERVRVS